MRETAMTTKDFVVFDADSHVVEPPALWEKYLDPEYRTLGKHALWRQEGRTGAYLKVNGEIFRDTGNPNLPRHALWRPGMDWDAIGALDPDVKHPAIEGASDPPHKTRIHVAPERRVEHQMARISNRDTFPWRALCRAVGYIRNR